MSSTWIGGTEMSGTGTIGFIGLGVMGRPMAAHLVNAGLTVVVHNRSQTAVDDLVAAGAVGAASPAEVAERADTIITMLPDAPDVEKVLFGTDGVTTTARPGRVVVDCSTIAPERAVTIAATLSESAIGFVDAPVSGGEHGAHTGNLAVMMGGSPSDIATATSAIAAFSGVVAHVGPVGSGQLVKAANQMIVAGNIALVAEALSLLQRTDVDMDAAISVLNGGLAASRVLENKARRMIDRDFTPGFRVDLHYKDLLIAQSAADQAGLATPVAAVVTQLVQALRASGDGGLDHGALITVIERLCSPNTLKGHTSCQQH
ncbi:NAD(P)-dependent oxidoreductase [Gordonia sp. p3-SID1431]|uniref:NAD(P)-dependent oxidoreductase n=1 Tax=Gordonia sp. p3-SID1431 TaxID=2916159 RepID=UPI0021A35FFB|nr:NAD(P)-dependent oxidoreductase [Gordonia sp. p3-SID1431]MCT1354991.1 NAD(P)-dependent oxidoreductase [Gordonia sp. p3-SID1431]